MTLVKVLDLHVVLHFNVLPKILRISFFAYLTFKNTRDFYIKGNMAMLLGLLGQPQHIKKLSFFFLPELSTHNTYPLHNSPILYLGLFFWLLSENQFRRHCKGVHSYLKSNLILCKIYFNICILMQIQPWSHNCCEKQLTLLLSLTLPLANWPVLTKAEVRFSQVRF